MSTSVRIVETFMCHDNDSEEVEGTRINTLTKSDVTLSSLKPRKINTVTNKYLVRDPDRDDHEIFFRLKV